MEKESLKARGCLINISDVDEVFNYITKYPYIREPLHRAIVEVTKHFPFCQIQISVYYDYEDKDWNYLHVEIIHDFDDYTERLDRFLHDYWLEQPFEVRDRMSVF